MAAPARGPGAVLIYDGGCGICSRLARAAARFAGERGVAVRAYQEIPAGAWSAIGLTAGDCARRLRFRAESGRLFGGAFAVNRFLLAASPANLGGRLVRAAVALCYALPPLLLLEIAAYEVFARNRRRFGSPACGPDADRLTRID